MQLDEHEHAAELMTWKVNGRLAGEDAAWLEAHLAECAACRTELAAQQRLRAALVREARVEFAPQPSFNRLWEQIETERDGARLPVAAGAAEQPSSAPVTRSGRRWRVGSRSALRAAVAAEAAAIVVLGFFAWQGHARAPAADYRTVTDSAAPATTQPFIKAVFDDQIRLGDVKEILGATGLVVAAGPTEAGVYTLTAVEAADAAPQDAVARRDQSLQRLRADPRVRFAEAGAP